MHTADAQKSQQEQFLVNEEFVNTQDKVSDDGATSIPQCNKQSDGYIMHRVPG